jgi:hypothetical protein
MTEPQLLSASEAAELLRMLPSRLVRLAKARAVPAVLLPDGEYRFDPSDLSAWVSAHKQIPLEPTVTS